MILALAPIEAGPAERAAAVVRRLHLEAERIELAQTRGRDLGAFGLKDDQPVGRKRIRQPGVGGDRC